MWPWTCALAHLPRSSRAQEVVTPEHVSSATLKKKSVLDFSGSASLHTAGTRKHLGTWRGSERRWGGCREGSWGGMGVWGAVLVNVAWAAARCYPCLFVCF